MKSPSERRPSLATLSLAAVLASVGALVGGCDDTARDPFALARDAEDASPDDTHQSDASHVGADGVGAGGLRTAADFAGLVVNEVDPAGAPADWFELYNGSETTLDLGGVTFTDDRAVPAKATFPLGTLVPPHGFLVREVSDADPGFRLAGDEELGLFAPDGTLIDLVDWAEGDVLVGQAIGRLPDGVGPRGPVAPTPGTPNATATGTPPPVVDVALNEVSSDGDDTIEIVNRGALEAALDGWWLSDGGYVEGDATTAAHRYDLPSGTTVRGGGYLVLVKGTDHSFGLGDVDEVALHDPTGAVVDLIAWASGEAVPSRCRLPDATGPLTTCAATPGAVNASLQPPVIDVVINEVCASGDDEIEIINRGEGRAELAGWAVSDDSWIAADPSTANHRWVFPAGTSLAAGARLVLVKGVHHGFGLGAEDTVTLWDADGTLRDSVNWTEGEAEVAWCREPDATGAFASCAAATFGATND